MTVEVNDTVERDVIGGVGPYPFSFRIFDEDDLAVSVVPGDADTIDLAINTDYTVDGVNDDEGGTVTLTSGAAALYAGLTLDIRSNTTEYQPTSIRNQGAFLPSLHEDAFDRLSRQVQDLARKVRGAPRYPDDSIDDAAAPKVDSRKGRYLFANAVTGAFEWITSITTTALSQTIFNQYLNDGLQFLYSIFNVRTSAEIAASVTPTNYAIPSHAAIGSILPERYGLSTSASGATNRSALERSIAVADQLGGGIISVPPGTFDIDATVTFDVNRLQFRCAGQNGTIWRFSPDGADVLFHATKGADSVVQCEFSGFGVTSSNSNSKTILKLDDIRDCSVHDIGCSSGNWAGAGSIGIHTNGRDTTRFSKIHILCARPILISANPNHATIDADHFHFTDMEIGSTETTGKIVEVEDGVYPTSLTFDGYQAWVLGKYGFYYDDTSAATIDLYAWRFQGIRPEQASDATGYSIYIASVNNDIKAVRFDNCYFDQSRNGIYGRSLETITIADTYFPGTTGITNLDITFGTRTQLQLSNTFVNVGSTVTLTNAVQVWAGVQNVAAEVIPKTAQYRFDEGALVSRKMRREDGVLHFSYKGTIGDDVTINLPITQTAGHKLAKFTVTCGSATGPVLEDGEGAWRPGTVNFRGSTNVATANTDTKLCALDSGNALIVINRLGSTMDIVFDAVVND